MNKFIKKNKCGYLGMDNTNTVMRSYVCIYKYEPLFYKGVGQNTIPWLLLTGCKLIFLTKSGCRYKQAFQFYEEVMSVSKHGKWDGGILVGTKGDGKK